MKLVPVDGLPHRLLCSQKGGCLRVFFLLLSIWLRSGSLSASPEKAVLKKYPDFKKKSTLSVFVWRG